VNNLSTSLLCLLLAPRILETAQKFGGRPRIVIVASEVHYFTSLDDAQVINATSSFQALSAKEFCTPEYVSTAFLTFTLANYATPTGKWMPDTSILNVSLLMGLMLFCRTHIPSVLNIFFTRSLASLLKDTPVIVDAVNPGFCRSELAREMSGMGGVLIWLMHTLLARTTEQGGRQLVYAAVGSSEDPDRLHGGYINLHKVDEPSDYVLGDAGNKRQEKLWVRFEVTSCRQLRGIEQHSTGRFGPGAFKD
jgi:hypothetical protein